MTLIAIYYCPVHTYKTADATYAAHKRQELATAASSSTARNKNENLHMKRGF